MVGGGDPFYLQFWFSRPRWSEIADFEPIFARSRDAAITPSEVDYALSNEPKMIIVRCP